MLSLRLRSPTNHITLLKNINLRDFFMFEPLNIENPPWFRIYEPLTRAEDALVSQIRKM